MSTPLTTIIDNNRNSIREFLVIFLIATLCLVAIGVAHYLTSAEMERLAQESDEQLNVALGQGAITRNLHGVVSDLLYLAEHNKYQGMFDGESGLQKAKLAIEFQVFSKRKQIYDQIRLLNEHGHEVIRVNYNNGDPVIIPEDLLQDKSSRYYFSSTLPLDHGQVFISPLDLNIEHGQIEQPVKPMLRLGTPIFDSAGNKKGVLLLNYLGDKLLGDFTRATANIADHVMLLNSDSFWLSNAGAEQEWGFMYGNDDSFKKRHPDVWQRILLQGSGQFHTGEGLFSHATVYPLSAAYATTLDHAYHLPGEQATSYYWKVVSHLSPPGPGFVSWMGQHLSPYILMLLLLGTGSAFLAGTRINHRQARLQVEFERRFRVILENVDLLAVVVDRHGRINFCNDALLNLIGRDRQGTMHRDWFEDFIAAGNREQCRQAFKHAVQDERPVHHECEVQTQDGGIRLVEWNVSLMRDSNEKVIGVTFIGEDVTEARQAEELVLQLSQAVEQSPATVIITDPAGAIEYVNPKFTQLTGYPLDEVRGMNPRLLKSGETSPDEYRNLWETVIAGGEWRGVFHNRKKNGELYWEQATISAIRNAEGEIAHFLAVKEDITERRRLEERFRHCVEAAPTAMVVVRENGEIVLVNKMVEKLFGYTRDELLGKPVEILVPDDARTKHSGLRNSFHANPQARLMGEGRDLRGLHKDGRLIPVEIGLSPIASDEGPLVLSVITDISEHRRLQMELEKKNLLSARTEALAAVGRMASMLAHDLRNPLSSIKMGLQIISSRLAGESKQEEMELNQIARDQIRYMESILEDMLSFARPDALNPEWQQIDKILETSILLSQKAIEEHGVQITTWYQQGLPNLHGDPRKLRQAFSNLIVNAIEATEEIEDYTPELSVSAKLRLGDDRPLVHIEICDNGCGIDPENRDNIFEPFFTTRSKGTGLGLAIATQIIDQHHGTLDLRPADNGGTCAVVILPTGPLESVTTGNRPVEGQHAMEDESAETVQ